MCQPPKCGCSKDKGMLMVCIIYGVTNDLKEVDGQASHPRTDGCGQIAKNGRETGLYRICSQEMDHRGTDTKTQDAGNSDGIHCGGGHPKRLGSRQRSGHHKTREPVAFGKRGFTGMLWPKERVAMLISLHQQGYSGTMVAEKMGMTRGQILGKAFRLGLSFARDVIISKPRIFDPTKARERRNSMENDLTNRLKPNKRIATKYGNVRITGLVSVMGVPMNCRAIVNGQGVDAIYCGKEVYKRSYCEGHFRKFYYLARSQPLPRY